MPGHTFYVAAKFNLFVIFIYSKLKFNNTW